MAALPMIISGQGGGETKVLNVLKFELASNYLANLVIDFFIHCQYLKHGLHSIYPLY